MESEEKLDLTFSTGLTTYQAGETQDDLMARLETALRAAKNEGGKKMKALVAGQDAQAVLSF